MEDFKRLIDNDLSDIEKIAIAFEYVTGRYIKFTEKDIDLARAMADKDSLIKEQIKNETVKHVRGIFQDCYYLVCGKRAWNE